MEKTILVALMLTLSACGSGGSGGSPVQTGNDSSTINELQKIAGNWTFTYPLEGTNRIAALWFGTVSKNTSSSISGIDYIVETSSILSLAPVTGGYSSSVELWKISGDGIGVWDFSNIYTAELDFKTDGETVLPGGCYYRVEKSTGAKSECIPLSGKKEHPPQLATAKIAITDSLPEE